MMGNILVCRPGQGNGRGGAVFYSQNIIYSRNGLISRKKRPPEDKNGGKAPEKILYFPQTMVY
jgi:hypothetical protein